MTEYINQLILTVVVCQTASMLVPENETAKRYLRTGDHSDDCFSGQSSDRTG